MAIKIALTAWHVGEEARRAVRLEHSKLKQ